MQSSSASVHGSVHPADAVMESAVARVAELLKRSDDLDKVELITQRLQREKAAIDVQLKAEVKSHIDSTGGAVIKLADSKRIMGEIRGELQKIDRLCSESQLSVRDFEKINRLANIHRNFIKTQEFADNMKNLHSRIQQVNDMIEDDCGDGQGGIEAQLDSHVPNLLTIHYMLSEMRDFRDSAMFHAERASEDTRRTTIKHFAPLDPLIAKFDRVVEDVGGNLLEFIRSGNTSLVVRLAKIIDLEEREDLKATVLLEVNGKAKQNGETGGRSQLNGNGNKHKKNNSMSVTLGNNVAPRTPRGYPTLFLRAMEKSIKDSFEACIESFPGDCITLLENLAWIYTDLELTRTELAAQILPRGDP
ncbi:Exocyst complex component SEC6 [Yarrowia sp. C11]|nr:Exocyst complex component SEC6 [Yarrowia sp. E02]KAG5369296.1 Exocyst complex component SEC6 [Yarrowia sp. C11]